MNAIPVAIGYLERFAADFERESGKMAVPEVAKSNGIKVAAIGSGPAGLTLLARWQKWVSMLLFLRRFTKLVEY